ncbi:MAG: hypothetical protein QHH04_07540 [Methanolinea sp.]|jgi:hypothetical protein|nr:hypothetical protein [Methanolinea sp.]
MAGEPGGQGMGDWQCSWHGGEDVFYEDVLYNNGKFVSCSPFCW